MRALSGAQTAKVSARETPRYKQRPHTQVSAYREGSTLIQNDDRRRWGRAHGMGAVSRTAVATRMDGSSAPNPRATQSGNRSRRIPSAGTSISRTRGARARIRCRRTSLCRARPRVIAGHAGLEEAIYQTGWHRWCSDGRGDRPLAPTACTFLIPGRRRRRRTTRCGRRGAGSGPLAVARRAARAALRAHRWGP